MESTKVNQPSEQQNKKQDQHLENSSKTDTPTPASDTAAYIKPNIIQRLQALPENERPEHLRPNLIQRLQALPENQKLNSIQRLQALPENERPEMLKPNLIQRLQRKQQEDNELQLKKDEDEKPTQLKKDEEEILQAKLQSGATQESEPVTISSGSGSKMPDDVKGKMENSFNADFSNVNIHANSDSAPALNALAFAQGNDIHFAPGQYDPSSMKGQEILGHELTHVVQQREGRVQPTTQLKGAGVNDSPELEREADEMGKLAAEGKSTGKNFAGASGSENPNTSVQRFEAPGHEAAERTALTAPRADGKELSNEEASMVYYGNWMRDMNQALVPALGNSLGVDVVFSLVNFLGFKKFGRYMNAEQFGYYIPSEHIDNPAGQISNSDYYSSAPKVSSMQNEPDRFNTSSFPARPNSKVTGQENLDPSTATVGGANIYSVDQTGVLAYIRRTNLHVEKRLEYAAQKGRTPEGMMHFGAALHAVEDLFAHSNFVEIALEKVLKENTDPADPKKSLVPGLKPEERYVRKMTSTVNNRPVLTTGTFTSLDTMESVGAEGVKMLREGLAPMPSEIEKEAQDKFVLELIKKADGPELKGKIIAKLKADKQTLLAATCETLDIVTIYTTLDAIGKALAINIQYLDDIKKQVRTYLNENVLNPAADQIEARLLITKVQDTPLYKGEKENQAIIDSGGTKTNAMQEVTSAITGKPVPAADNKAEAEKKQALLSKTPEKIKAGPSHSQLSKDHSDSIFFGMAFKLAVEADKLIRNKMIDCWGSATPVKDPYTDLLSKDPSKLNKDQKQEQSFARKQKDADQKSLDYGIAIDAQGKDPSQSYSLANIRNESAERIFTIANGLDILLNSPKAVRDLLNIAGSVKGLKDLNSDTQNMIKYGIAVINNATMAVDQFNADFELQIVSQEFRHAGEMVKSAKTLEQREAAYKKLLDARNLYVEWVIKAFKSKSIYAKLGIAPYTSFAIAIDRELAAVAPAYPKEQIDILSSPTNPLAQQTLTLPSLANVANPAVKGLLETSRMIINHPYENNWWEPHVKKFLVDHPEQIAEEIRARNAGYVKFDGNHHH
jgi:hypothetical protein